MDLLEAAFRDSFLAQLVIAPTGEILDANDQACVVFGQRREDLLALKLEDLIVNDGVDLFTGLAAKFQTNNLLNWQTEQRYQRHNSSILWANVCVSAIRDDQKVTALLLQLQDITEQKRGEEALQRNTEDLEQFVYIASHDLREPLIGIAGFASLLKKRYADKLDETGLHFLNEVLDSARRMEMKIDDLLAFSRAGRMGVVQGVFPLGAAIEEARRALVRRIEEAQATIEIQSDLPIIQGDRGLIAQVFQNLFSNSIKYKGVEPPRIQVTVEPYNDDNYWLVAVKDNGLGFDMQHKERIFGVFQRLYTPEQYPGTGIGLAIAKKIVERHRGRIWPFSEPGKGATFFFTLPCAPQ